MDGGRARISVEINRRIRVFDAYPVDVQVGEVAEAGIGAEERLDQIVRLFHILIHIHFHLVHRSNLDAYFSEITQSIHRRYN